MAKDLDHYLKTWRLSHPHLLATTPTSHIYTVVTDTTTIILKLLTPLGAEDEWHGAIALQHFDGHGSVRLLRYDERAHLLEYADGDELAVLVEQGEDEQATVIIAEVLNQLHCTPLSVPIDGLIPLETWFRGLFRKAQNEPAGSIWVRGAKIARGLLDHPGELRVLHGDIHHQNIRYHAERGWLAFDPKGLWGERTFDAANTLCNPVHMPMLVANERRFLRNAHILAERLQIEFARLMAFTFSYACLSASWSISDGQDPSLALQVATIAEAHLEILA